MIIMIRRPSLLQLPSHWKMEERDGSNMRGKKMLLPPLSLFLSLSLSLSMRTESLNGKMGKKSL